MKREANIILYSFSVTLLISRAVFCVGCISLGTPGMGVNLWGVSPLYVNPVNVKSSWTLTKVLAEGKGEIVRDRPKEAGVQNYEPTNRNSIQG
jgi:hypothetical protein